MQITNSAPPPASPSTERTQAKKTISHPTQPVHPSIRTYICSHPPPSHRTPSEPLTYPSGVGAALRCDWRHVSTAVGPIRAEGGVIFSPW
ncbi:hypothetical protein P171DRAFT_425755 [Karstenula rhodostoma CBS 690.94]|uniref:Uncharacterized protein n=1 Tax=Karstenula rhodostoma CBS 690.94 TaxID=1392251 RepID=A0A9P4PVY6_9PLEO|nr:hypothetical protein P171DRAFT_425755 [Karstenula rhodostoma CBS 690.94]